ncbi:MAG: hypothetical protein ABIS47_05765 [Acidimicrobiales bacterium]
MAQIIGMAVVGLLLAMGVLGVRLATHRRRRRQRAWIEAGDPPPPAVAAALDRARRAARGGRAPRGRP